MKYLATLTLLLTVSGVSFAQAERFGMSPKQQCERQMHTGHSVPHWNEKTKKCESKPGPLMREKVVENKPAADELSGCKKEDANTISCPDGVYKKGQATIENTREPGKEVPKKDYRSIENQGNPEGMGQ